MHMSLRLEHISDLFPPRGMALRECFPCRYSLTQVGYGRVDGSSHIACNMWSLPACSSVLTDASVQAVLFSSSCSVLLCSDSFKIHTSYFHPISSYGEHRI